MALEQWKNRGPRNTLASSLATVPSSRVHVKALVSFLALCVASVSTIPLQHNLSGFGPEAAPFTSLLRSSRWLSRHATCVAIGHPSALVETVPPTLPMFPVMLGRQSAESCAESRCLVHEVPA